MFLGGVPAYSRGTTFDPARIAAKHRPASRKFQLDKSEVDRLDEENPGRDFSVKFIGSRNLDICSFSNIVFAILTLATYVAISCQDTLRILSVEFL